MLSCRRATERLSRSLDETLPVAERIGLRAHLVMCSPCRLFRSQLQLLEIACKMMADRAEPANANSQLSDAARIRIAAALESDRG